MDVRDKVAVVTGAGSGIGRATALRLAREGARVVVADVVADTGRETVGMIAASGGEAGFRSADVTNEADITAMYAFAAERFGGIDIVFNNAGTITPPPRFPAAESARWQRTLDINLRGVVLGTHHAIPLLRERGGGVIVQTASIAGLMPYEVDPVYAASKAGVVNFTRSLGYLKAEANIRVNCVCPGIVETNLALNARGPLSAAERAAFEAQRAQMRGRRVLSADDVAAAVLRLITDDDLCGKAYRIAASSEWELV